MQANRCSLFLGRGAVAALLLRVAACDSTAARATPADDFPPIPTNGATIEATGTLADGRLLLENGCTLGDQRDCAQLSGVLLTGVGAPADVVRARLLALRACDTQVVGCQTMLAIYRDGLGVRADKLAALRFALLGCRLADGRASAELCTDASALFLESSPGDAKHARFLAKRGCDAGSQRGCDALARLE